MKLIKIEINKEYFEVFRRGLKQSFEMIGIYQLIFIIWSEIEKYHLDKTNPNLRDTIIALILTVAIYIGLNWDIWRD